MEFFNSAVGVKWNKSEVYKMIEIVFGESACGSLKIAQTYGKGKYRGSAVSIFMRHEDRRCSIFRVK